MWDARFLAEFFDIYTLFNIFEGWEAKILSSKLRALEETNSFSARCVFAAEDFNGEILPVDSVSSWISGISLSERSEINNREGVLKILY